MLDLVPGEAWD